MSIVPTLTVRALRLAEAQLSQLDSPLASAAKRKVHDALLDVLMLERLEERNSLDNHATGDRAA